MIYALGAIPTVVTGQRALPPGVAVVPAELTLLTSMFLHGSSLHLGGNMLFLWIFGDNVEDAMGHVRFLFFYLICGVAAALVHIYFNLGSEMPTVGASGAISGILGAYLILHPRAEVPTLFFRFFITLPAFVVLGVWIGLQALSAYFETDDEAGGVAWRAHIGGFVVGAILVIPFRRRGVPLFERDAVPPVPPRTVITRLRHGSVPPTRRRW
jgi:membrane associated rhomboid family serine protease